MESRPLSLKHLMLIITATYTVLSLVIMLIIRAVWLFPLEIEQSTQLQQQELLTLQQMIDQRQVNLDRISLDYRNRIEVIEMMDRNNLSYVLELFGLDMMRRSMLDDVYLLDAAGNAMMRLALVQNTQSLTFEPSPEWVNEAITSASTQQPNGYIRSENNQLAYYTLTASHDYDDALDHPPRGWLLLRSDISSDDLARIGDYSRLNLTLLSEPPGKIDLKFPLTSEDIARQLPTPQATHFVQLGVDGDHSPAVLEADHRENIPEFLDRRLLYNLVLAVVLPMTLWWLLVRLVVMPVKRSTRELKENTASGQLKPLSMATSTSIEELSDFNQAYNQLADQARKQQQQLRELSTTDSLTHIANRLAFDRALKETWARILRRQTSVAVVMVDIDHFKAYNDHYGHPAGDDALSQVANALVRCAQRADEIVARYGGEEFAMIIYVQDAIELDNFRKRIKRVIRDLEIEHAHSSSGPYLTVSTGICWIIDSGYWLIDTTAKDWMKAADIALYEAKAAGRNCSMLQIMGEHFPADFRQ